MDPVNAQSAPYCFDDAKVDAVRSANSWMAEVKYFKRVIISPSAAMKMMMHAQSGVDKGLSSSGKPLEVMGLLLGRPDTDDERRIIISDAQPLPVEGFETRVVADDVNVINYMIALSESMELTRKERFCGWYHSHPFDLAPDGHCYLSSTDITTQLHWQRSEDPHGNPWLAIVIDPLRSVAKAKPELKAFRVFPPEYNHVTDETPDGSVIKDDRLRVEKWGVAWNRYYTLDISYFMSGLATNTLNILRKKTMWMNVLCSSESLTEGLSVDNIITLALIYIYIFFSSIF
jgi:COP9 signalosome complex subunit 5